MLCEIENFLIELGTNTQPHGQVTFYDHLKIVGRNADTLGLNKKLATAAYLHSLYGTEYFNVGTIPFRRRDIISVRFGEETENLVYLYCSSSFSSILRSLERDHGHKFIWDRFLNSETHLSELDFENLLKVHICNIFDGGDSFYGPKTQQFLEICRLSSNLNKMIQTLSNFHNS